MESAESSSPVRFQGAPSPGVAALRARIRDAVVVLQVDGAVTGIHGLSWLTARRDDATRRRLAELQVTAMAEGWTHAEFDRARLAVLRPRRAEVHALGQAYLAALTPGAADAAHRMRRAGVAVELSGEVAVEALLGVAGALGVTPDAIHAPRIRFDALGSFVGVDAGERVVSIAHGAGPVDGQARAYVGTRASERLADRDRDLFVRFTGVVAHEGPRGGVRGESVETFAELAELVVG